MEAEKRRVRRSKKYLRDTPHRNLQIFRFLLCVREFHCVERIKHVNRRRGLRRIGIQGSPFDDIRTGDPAPRSEITDLGGPPAGPLDIAQRPAARVLLDEVHGGFRTTALGPEPLAHVNAGTKFKNEDFLKTCIVGGTR